LFSFDLVCLGCFNGNEHHICDAWYMLMLLLYSFIDSGHFEILITWRGWSCMPCCVQTLACFQFLFQNRVCYYYSWLYESSSIITMLFAWCCLWWLHDDDEHALLLFWICPEIHVSCVVYVWFMAALDITWTLLLPCWLPCPSNFGWGWTLKMNQSHAVNPKGF
jgi:hypothetical protein